MESTKCAWRFVVWMISLLGYHKIGSEPSGVYRFISLTWPQNLAKLAAILSRDLFKPDMAESKIWASSPASPPRRRLA